MGTRHATILSFLLASLAFAQSDANAERGSETESPARCSESDGHAARIVEVSQLRGVRDFDFAELRLEHSARPSVVIEGAAAAIANISTRVDDGILVLERSGCVASATPIRVTISAPSFEEIGIRSSATLSSHGVLRGAASGVTIDLDGAASTSLSIDSDSEVVVFADGAGLHSLLVNAPSLVALHTGSGELSLSGRATSASLAELGRGTVASKGLVAKRLVVDIEGGGTVTALR